MVVYPNHVKQIMTDWWIPTVAVGLFIFGKFWEKSK